MTARTAAAAGSDAPASITPSVSSVARRTWAIAASGASVSAVLTTNSARRAVALMARRWGRPPAVAGRPGPRENLRAEDDHGDQPSRVAEGPPGGRAASRGLPG